MKKDNLFPLDDTAAATLEEKIESYYHLRTAKDKNIAENILTGLTYIIRNLKFVHRKFLPISKICHFRHSGFLRIDNVALHLFVEK